MAPHRNVLRAYLSGDYDHPPEEKAMPETTFQARRAKAIAAEYDGTVRVAQNIGPSQDRTVVAAPDGRIVVIDPAGSVLADSLRGSPIHPSTGDQMVAAAREELARRDAADGYDPAYHALVIECCNGEVALIPPWRCAMSVTGHLPPEGVAEALDQLRAWAVNFAAGGSLVVWRLARSATTLRKDD